MKKKIEKEKIEKQAPQRLSYFLICLAYLLIPVYTPDLKTLDSNGTGFLMLSLINIFALGYMWFDPTKALQEFAGKFFSNKSALCYSLFLIVASISFVKSINISESIISLSKLITVFTAVFNFSFLIKSDSRIIKKIAIALSLLLIVDGIVVMFNITKYIMGKLDLIYDIRYIFSNKNLFSVSIFLKIPLALWLFYFEKDKLKKLGATGLFFGFSSVLFLSTRAFYLGLVIFTILFILYAFRRHFLNKKEHKPTAIRNYLLILIASVTLFTCTQLFLYPIKKDKGNKNIASRLATIQSGDPVRTTTWLRSWNLIKKNPLLGVGTGNWKVEILKQENFETPGYNYSYKNHNDFIEIATETGLIGLLCYLGVFAFILIGFVKFILSKDESPNLLFIAGFGIIGYVIDAFFNFPIDRPETQTYFIVFLGIAFSTGNTSAFKYSIVKENWLQKIVPAKLMILGIACLCILWLNFKSLRVQRILENDLVHESFTHSFDFFNKNLPKIPNISAKGEPLNVNKAYFLYLEGKHEEAIKLLKSDRTSPYDTRQNFFIANSYSALNKLDSAIFYYQKVLVEKPLFFDNVRNYVNALERNNQYKEAEKILSDFILKMPQKAESYELRAMCYFYQKEYSKCIKDINIAIAKGMKEGNLYNVRGVCMLHSKENYKACKDFEHALSMGNKEAENNINLFCRKN